MATKENDPKSIVSLEQLISYRAMLSNCNPVPSEVITKIDSLITTKLGKVE